MVFLNPDASVRSKFPNVDFDVLSCVYTTIFDANERVGKRRYHYVVNIRIVKDKYSWYAYQTGTTVNLAISEIVDTELYFQRTLLHEFRHFMQDKIFKVRMTKANYDESDMKTYRTSPIEMDAQRFENEQLYKVLRLYQRILKAKSKLKMDFAQLPQIIGPSE